MICISSPRILIHEYVTGGGWPDPEFPVGLAAEALAMVTAVLNDFQAWEMVQVITTLDARIPSAGLPADQVITIQPERYALTLTEIVSSCPAALVIAPETGGALTQISHQVASTGTQLLGASPAAVAIAADKWQCYQLFRQNAIPTPTTWLVDGSDAFTRALEVGFPLVAKPRDGAGANGLSRVADQSALPPALALAGMATGECLLQSYVPGVHASVSLLSDGKRTLPLSLNEQRISTGVPFEYQGGRIPLKHCLQEQAMALAQQAVALIPGLKGYVGVDLVLTQDKCYVIEVNPRITTSYVGLRQVINLNLAEAIWQACCVGRLPDQVELRGTISFEKDGACG
jgi:predicted ATP-grasp superfamily ATP-dependent carboligase